MSFKLFRESVEELISTERDSLPVCQWPEMPKDNVLRLAFSANVEAEKVVACQIEQVRIELGLDRF